VLFVVTEDWYFVSHRLALARVLQRDGFEVALASRFTVHRAPLEAEGIRCHPIQLRRRASSLWAEWRAIAELRSLYRDERPDIVHHVALKPVVFGGLAALGLRGLRVVHAIAGLGFLYSSSEWRAQAGRWVAAPLLRLLLGRPTSWVIVQNPDDAATLRDAGIGDAARTQLIRGAGVDLAEFQPDAVPAEPSMVLCAGRMLRDKGVPEFVEAAALLRRQGVHARFVLAGGTDPDNPRSLTEAELKAWVREGTVEWLGRRSDMPEVLASAAVVCLPTTYGEGIPKILIEAAASARPIVATAWPGCREVVRDGVNGLLVPPRDPVALAAALGALLGDPHRRAVMGAAGRAIAERDFSIESVAAATIELYHRMLAPA
jgi:glycosyltransferase involved in cell wall biosynthesis